jgi:zinc transporter ZupT
MSKIVASLIITVAVIAFVVLCFMYEPARTWLGYCLVVAGSVLVFIVIWRIIYTLIGGDDI